MWAVIRRCIEGFTEVKLLIYLILGKCLSSLLYWGKHAQHFALLNFYTAEINFC